MKRETAAPLEGFGAGKVILLGEHGVVYGYPALAGPLAQGVRARAVRSRRCRLVMPESLAPAQRRMLKAAFDTLAQACGQPQVDVSLEADLPMSMGLGSSAALSVACTRVLLQAAGRRATPNEVARLAWAMEQEFHGTPSGVDHTTSAWQQMVLYRKSPRSKLGQAQPLDCPRPLHVVVALAGERSPTKITVAALRARQARWPKRYARIFEEMGQLAQEGAEAVEDGDLESLGDAMNLNHGLLGALGLSSLVLEDMVHRMRRMGALGAKLTGAGGDGGAVVGLFRETEAVLAELERHGIPCFASQLAGPRAQ